MRLRYLRFLAVSLPLLAFQGTSPLGPPVRVELDPPLQGVCTTNPPASYSETVHGSVDGDDLAVRVSGRVAGSIDSLTWRGKEFVNDYDHGREISYAWAFDGYGECFNPTEPGAARDGLGPRSTSQWLSVCRDGENQLTTETVPAFWLSPAHPEHCGSSAFPEAVRLGPLADQHLTRTIQIGYQGLDNVIALTAVITQPADHGDSQSEIPTGYLTYEFTSRWVFNPATGVLALAEPQDVTFPWSFVHSDTLPPILATEDGQYAMGAYSPELVRYYEILFYDVPNPADRTNKWSIVVHEEPAPPGTYTYRSYLIVGTLKTVQENMQQLYAMEPGDLNPPSGYVDTAKCDGIYGWAWDPKAQNQPVEVEVYDAPSGGEQVLLARTTAATFRQDLADALGDNGDHGFQFDPRQILPDSEPHTLRIYAINSDPALPHRELFGSGVQLQCAGIKPAASPTPTSPPPTPTPPASTPTTEPKPSKPPQPAATPAGGALPCPGLAPPLGLAVAVAWQRRRRRRQLVADLGLLAPEDEQA